MPRSDNAQLNVRSTFARARAHELARCTGMTATEVVEDALRGYEPPAADPERVGVLVRRGPVLVHPAQERRISHEKAERALDAARGREV